MFPHERSLVKQLANKPFALIGVNSDDDRPATIERMAKENLTWRSFWNSGVKDGAIAKDWNLRGYPTIYVIDQQGIIRYKCAGGLEVEIDAALTNLLGVEVESEPSTLAK